VPVGNLIDLSPEKKSNEKTNEKKCTTVMPKEMKGFLTKVYSIGPIKTQKRYYFLLDEETFHLYAYKQQTPVFKPDFVEKIPIRNSSFSFLLDDVVDEFTITTTNNVIHKLKADSLQELTWWVENLQQIRTNYCNTKLPKKSGNSTFYLDENDTTDGLLASLSNKTKKCKKQNSSLAELSSITSKSNESSENNSRTTSDLKVYGHVMGNALKGLKSGISKGADPLKNKIMEKLPIVEELKSIIRDKDMEIELLNTKLNAREEAMLLLKREFSKYESLSLNENLSSEYANDLDVLKDENQKLKKQVLSLNETVEMLKEKVKIKENVANGLDQKLKRLSGNISSSSSNNLARECHLNKEGGDSYVYVDTQAEEIKVLKNNLEAYKLQNKFLNNEIVDLFQIKKKDEEKIKELETMYFNRDAEFLQMQSKFLVMLSDKSRDQQGFSSLGGANLGFDEAERKENIRNLINNEIEKNNVQISAKGGEYDEYGFSRRLTIDDASLKQAAQHSAIQRLEMDKKFLAEKKQHINNWKQYIDNHEKLERSYELKMLIRNGIPNSLRSKVWGWIVKQRTRHIQERILSKFGEGYYEQMVQLAQPELVAKQIELDLLRTLPYNKFFNSNSAAGIDPLRRVLRAYSNHNPAIGYTQGLNRLAAVALLFTNEEDAFWTLVAIIECILPNGYYSETLIASQADQRVFKDLLGEKSPRLLRHMTSHKMDTTLITFNWFLCIFCDNLHHHITFHVWDIFLYEGSKVLFRFALALFKLNEEEILRYDDHAEVFNFMKNMTNSIIDPRKLTQCAFEGMNPFPMHRITRMRNHHLVEIKNEIETYKKFKQSVREIPDPPTPRHHSDEEA